MKNKKNWFERKVLNFAIATANDPQNATPSFVNFDLDREDESLEFKKLAKFIEENSLTLSDKNEVLDFLANFCEPLRDLKLKNFYTQSKKISTVLKNAQIGIQINFADATVFSGALFPALGKKTAVIVWENGKMEILV